MEYYSAIKINYRDTHKGILNHHANRETRHQRIYAVGSYLYQIQEQAKQEKTFPCGLCLLENLESSQWLPGPGVGRKFPINGHERMFLG